MVCFWINFCQRHFRDYGVFTECRTPHVVIKRLPIVRKTGGAVWHQAFTLGFANRNTEVSFARTTELTLAALCGVKRDHMVAWFDAGYAFTDFNHNANPFVTENHREYTFRVIAGEGKCVGMANAGMGDFNQHFTFFGGATSISTISSGLPGANATAARDFISRSSSIW